MKAEELMHNDLALLDGKVVRFDTYCGFVRLEDGAQFPRSIKVDTIPLTPEILEKNGINGGLWEDYYGHVLLVKNNRIMYLFDGHKRLDLPYNRVIYVHELQHALRLCGLNELADNFKV